MRSRISSRAQLFGRCLLGLAGLVGVVTMPARADSMGTVDATTIGSLTTASLSFVSGGLVTGQTFTVPGADNVLTEWQFWVDGWLPGHGVTDDIGLAIYDWTGQLKCPCTPLFTTSVAWPTLPGVVSLTGLNVPLISGQTYAVVYDIGDYNGSSLGIHDINLYPDGQLLLAASISQLGLDAPTWTGLDTGFAATFETSAAQSGVPEPSSLSMMVLVALIIAARSPPRFLLRNDTADPRP
ncbi:MAG TPA: hypothetical protein VGF16_12945 [Bryobacteraceae bacterium]